MKIWTADRLFRSSMFSSGLLNDLSCRHVVASTFNYPPFVYAHKHKNGSVTFTGTEVKQA